MIGISSKLLCKEKSPLKNLIELSSRVSDLHAASILLRELDTVERFISSESEENSDLANLIMDDWQKLETDLALANSVDDILESEFEIKQMKMIIDISSRIGKIVDISQASGVKL